LQRNLTGVDLSNRDLGQFDLGDNNLTDAQMYGVHLDHATLVDTILKDAKLNLAQLSGAFMRGASLVGASLAGANLNNANLNEGSLRGASAGLYVIGKNNARFATLVKAQLIDVDMRGACLAGADLQGAQLGGAKLQNADLDDANLQGAKFENVGVAANLSGASFSGAKLGKSPSQGAPSPATTDEHPAPPKPQSVPPGALTGRVVKIANGDTIELEHLGWVRLLGVDTPSVSDRSKAPAPRERVGQLASGLTASLAPVHSDIRYTPPHPQREDKAGTTGRRLVYVWTANGQFLNELLLERGLALRETDQRAGSSYSRLFDAAQLYARDTGQGVWATCPDFAANDAVLLPPPRRHGRDRNGP
jgi:uncharacterized protein YjbI with pentapeptide repeats